jgi:hypothetical protein
MQGVMRRPLPDLPGRIRRLPDRAPLLHFASRVDGVVWPAELVAQSE